MKNTVFPGLTFGKKVYEESASHTRIKALNRKQAMNTVKIKQFERVYKHGKTQITGKFAGYTVTFFFGSVKVGYGTRYYFICPVCGKYREELIFNGTIFTCFSCAGVNPYAGIQQSTRGGETFITYKMYRYARTHKIEGFHFPFSFYDYPRPKRRNPQKWHDAIKILQALENMRNQSIFFSRVWNVKTIRSVERGTNAYLTLPVLYHLEYFYPYDENLIETDNSDSPGSARGPPEYD